MTNPPKYPPESPPTYRVIMSGVVLPENARTEVIDKLVALFHSQPDTMTQLLRGKETRLTRKYPRKQAEKICQAIRAAGAECRMEEVDAPPISLTKEELAVQQNAGHDDSSTDSALDNQHGNRPEHPHAHEHDSHGHDDAHDDEHDDDHDDDHVHEHPDEEQTTPRPDGYGWQSAMLRFVAVNTDYYAHQFAKFGDIDRPSFALSWHWPSFFAFILWAAYRKLWLLAGANIIGGLLIGILFQSLWIYLAWALFWPLTANYLYFQHIRTHILTNMNADTDDKKTQQNSAATAFSSGGVSRLALLLSSIIMVFTLWTTLKDQTDGLVDIYLQQIGETLPPGSRQRGDGSSIDDITTLAPKVARTATDFGIRALKLKLTAAGAGTENNQHALLELSRDIANNKIKDAWGNNINLRQDAAGQTALISAGPDGKLDSNDDILQYINLNGRLNDL